MINNEVFPFKNKKKDVGTYYVNIIGVMLFLESILELTTSTILNFDMIIFILVFPQLII